MEEYIARLRLFAKLNQHPIWASKAISFRNRKRIDCF